LHHRLSRFGIGPGIALAAIVYMAAAAVITYEYPRICMLEQLSQLAVVYVARLLLVLGVVMWIAGVIAAMRAYDRDELATTGAFAFVRHPMYSAVIVFVLPGLTLATTSWPLVLTPLVAYAVFKRYIRREDDYLAKRFGPAYLDYRRRVPELIPFL
jgi:protein-S-isoprenylcysteine O-methyltransferase Ste14